VVQPTVSWHAAEYEALGVPFRRRGRLLDEHLAAWDVLWRDSPASFHGEHYRFDDVYLEPKPYRETGPVLWFGGSSLHDRLLQRLVRYGSGFNPLGSPAPGELERLAQAMHEADRDPGELELVGGTRGRFPDEVRPASLAEALESVPAQLERGFTTICIKPNQFVDDPSEIAAFCCEAVARVEAMAG
jgi:Luciferase-like monooxygenase